MFDTGIDWKFVGLYELMDCHTMFAPEAGLVQKAAAKEGFSKLAQAEARAMTGREQFCIVLHIMRDVFLAKDARL